MFALAIHTVLILVSLIYASLIVEARIDYAISFGVLKTSLSVGFNILSFIYFYHWFNISKKLRIICLAIILSLPFISLIIFYFLDQIGVNLIVLMMVAFSTMFLMPAGKYCVNNFMSETELNNLFESYPPSSPSDMLKITIYYFTFLGLMGLGFVIYS